MLATRTKCVSGDFKKMIFLGGYFFLVNVYKKNIHCPKNVEKKKFGKNKVQNIFCVKGNSANFWIKSPKSTGYWVSMVSVFESGSLKYLSSRNLHFCKMK